MRYIGERIARLIDLKSILSIVLVCTTCYLAISEKVSSDTFIAITMSVVTFYFTKKDKEGE